MPEALPAEELHQLASQLPNFHESPHLKYLAERKLLPQQNDVPSFENPDFLTGLRRSTYGLTKKEQQLIKRQDEALVPFQQEEELKNKLHVMQQFAQANAPTYGEVNQRGIGIPAPMQEQPVTIPGSAELPGTFNIDELQPGPTVGMSPSNIQFGQPGSQVAQPLRAAPTYQDTTLPLQVPNPGARLSPTDLKLYDNVVGGQGVMEGGKYTPMALAKAPGSLMKAEDATAHVQALFPETSGLKLFTAPVAPSVVNDTVQKLKDRELANAKREYFQSMTPQNLNRVLDKYRNVQADEVRKAEFDPNRPHSNVTTNVNSYTPASVEAQKDYIKGARGTYDQLKQAQPLLDNIDRAKALIPKAKGFMGTGGETLLEAAKFMNNRVGLSINTEGVKSAEELRSRIFFNIMDNLKKMDAQPSQQQQEVMQNSLGKLGTDPTALAAVLDAYADVVTGKVDQYNQDVSDAEKRGVKFPYNPTIRLKARQAAKAEQDAGGPPKVTNEQDYQAIKPGSTYIAPDGSVRTKK